jgi:hypothetical protein
MSNTWQSSRSQFKTAAVAGVLAVAMTATTCPLAHAGNVPDVSGKKYRDATTILSNAGLQPVVSTAVGDRESWPDCVVTFVQMRDRPTPPNSGGGTTPMALVSLNCDAAVASATTPGYSAQSPEGKAIGTRSSPGSS